jgi:cytochrome bd-type quinol oxidase subunit 2
MEIKKFLLGLPTSSKKLISKLPLLGGLPKCSIEDHKNAFIELFFTLLFSFSPILITILGDYYFWDDKTSFSVLDSIVKNIKNGELFLYVSSLMAPIFYTILRDRKSQERFPSGLSNMFFYFLIVLISALSFAYQRAGNVNQASLFLTSKYVFCFSVLLYYLILVYNNYMIPNPAEEMRDSEQEFSDQVAKHRGVS